MEVIGDRTFLGMLRSGGMHQRGRGRKPSLPVACIEGTDGVYLVGKGHSGKLLRNLFITPSCANERVKASKGR